MRTLVKQAGRAARLMAGSPHQKRKARYNLAAMIASRFGFRMYGPQTSWYDNREFAEAWRRFPHKEGLIQDRRFNLYNLAKSWAIVEGDLAECGANVGRGSYLMLHANEHNDKHLYAFDSFEGLSQPTGADRPRDPRAQPWEAHEFAVDEAVARTNLAAFEGRFTLLKGWVPERFADVSEKRFSLVHIDLDLYEPTKSSVEFFWPRLSRGGLIVCDDYGSRRCPGARQAMDEFAEGARLRVAELTTMQGLLFKAV